MKNICVWLLSATASALIAGLAGTLPAHAASNAGTAGKPSDDIFIKCATSTHGVLVITQDKFKAVGDNLADSDFAKYDPQCLGKDKNPQGVAKAQSTKKNAAGRVAQDLNDIAVARVRVPGKIGQGVPANVARTAFGMVKPTPLPLLFRDAYSTYSLLSPPPPKERATGTQISYAHDYAADNDVFSGKGALIGWDALSVKRDSDNPLASFGVTRMLWAPGIEFDQNRNHADATKNVDYIAFKLISEYEKESATSLFPLQYFRYAGYWKTDSRGASRIGGIYGEWEPYKLEWAIGVAPLLFGGPMQFRWSPILHAEAERVFDAGDLSKIHTGDEFARIGPIVQADIFFADGPLGRLTLNAQYRYLWNSTRASQDADVSYFQATASYNLDEAGYAALSITYRDGITPGNTVSVRDLKSGITVKY